MAKSFEEEIRSGQKLILRTFGPSQENDENLLQAITELCQHYQVPEFTSIFFTLVKDLVLNGYKANFKRIFFEDHKMNINSPAEYELGIRQYKSFMQMGKTGTYPKKAEERGYFVETTMEHSANQVLATVRNNHPLALGEMAKIKHSMYHSQNYQDIMEYYIEKGDNSEGEGIGIALCVILLKGEGIPTENFRISSNTEETLASLKIPLDLLRKKR